MSTKEKLIKRLLLRPKDFTIQELNTLLQLCNCKENHTGKTTGSKISYTHIPTLRQLSIHKPHPQNTLLPYVIKLVIVFLESTGEI